MGLKGIKLVTFDITNTLLNFRMPPWQYYTVVAKEYGFQGKDDALKDKVKRNTKYLWEKYPNFGKSSILWEEWWTRLVEMSIKDHMPVCTDLRGIARKIIDDYRSAKCWRIAEGGDMLIEHLKKSGITVGVISNFDPRLYEILKCIKWDKKFDFILASYDIDYIKPDKKIFKCALDKCQGAKPSQALHIGDDVAKDYEGAQAAGWHALLVNPTMNSETPPAPQHVFSSIDNLYKTIAQGKLKL